MNLASKANGRNDLRDLPELILNLGALFKKDFTIDWIIELSGARASEALSALEKGSKNGILKKIGFSSFCFADPETQEDFLAPFSNEQRKRLHQRAANIIIDDDPKETSNALAAAHHLVQTKNDIETCRLLVQIGDTLTEAKYWQEAQECYKKVIVDLKSERGSKVNHLFIDAVIKYSWNFFDVDDPWTVIQIKEAIKKAKREGEDASCALLKLNLAKNEMNCRRHDSARNYFEDGWKDAQTLKNTMVMQEAVALKIIFMFIDGRYSDIVSFYGQNIQIVGQWPKSKMRRDAAMFLGFSFVATGQVRQGLALLNGLYIQSQDLGDQTAMIEVSFIYAYSLIEIGRPEEAIRILDETQKKANTYQGLTNKEVFPISSGWAYCETGDFKSASLAVKKYVKANGPLKLFDAMLADFANSIFSDFVTIVIISMENHRYPDMERYFQNKKIERMISEALDSKNINLKGMVLLLKALRLKKKKHSPLSLLEILNSSIDYFMSCGNAIRMAKTQLERSRIYLEIGDEQNAKKDARDAFRILSPINKNLIPEDLYPLSKSKQIGEGLVEKILRLGQDIMTIRDNMALVRHIISTVNRITGAERGAIFRVDKRITPPRITLFASNVLTMSTVADKNFSRSMQIIEDTIESKSGKIVKMDVEENIGQFPNTVPRSCFCIPLVLKDEIVGILYHDNCIFVNLLKVSDLKILSFFAGMAAIAMDNAMAYEEIQLLNEQLKGEKEYYKKQLLNDLHYRDFIGKSQKILNVYDQISRVAGEDSTVQIMGETGVGKELVACIIHRESKRKDRPFIRVDCSALTGSLITSELFGHEKGAFTGASAVHVGRFELANGGTLFLDEIGNLPMDVQVMLLRVLQTKEFQRVGGTNTFKSDFRLITATNVDLLNGVRKGLFREDLYYRLNVFPIAVPPLRERKDDIPILVEYFLQEFAEKNQCNVKKIGQAEMERLMAYPWPGNVRELRNVIERAIILSPRSRLILPELDIDRKRSEEKLPVSLDDCIKNHIIWALGKTGGKIGGKDGAAELLKLHPSTLHFRIKKYGIIIDRRSIQVTAAMRG